MFLSQNCNFKSIFRHMLWVNVIYRSLDYQSFASHYHLFAVIWVPWSTWMFRKVLDSKHDTAECWFLNIAKTCVTLVRRSKEVKILLWVPNQDLKCAFSNHLWMLTPLWWLRLSLFPLGYINIDRTDRWRCNCQILQRYGR